MSCNNNSVSFSYNLDALTNIVNNIPDALSELGVDNIEIRVYLGNDNAYNGEFEIYFFDKTKDIDYSSDTMFAPDIIKNICVKISDGKFYEPDLQSILVELGHYNLDEEDYYDYHNDTDHFEIDIKQRFYKKDTHDAAMLIASFLSDNISESK